MKRGLVLQAIALHLTAGVPSLAAAVTGEPRLDDRLDDRLEDQAALMIADTSTADVVHADKPWHLTVEGSVGLIRSRDTSSTIAARGALDFSLDQRVTPEVQVVFRDRIDDFSQANASGHHTINTWKEGYVAWQPLPQASVEIGRVNVRQGVATGYNPTDWFRKGAVRAVPSVAPDSLRQNRQGSMVVRGQWLWDGATAFALFSPDLGDSPSQEPFSPDLAATNRSNRFLTGVSAPLTERLQGQLLLQGDDDQSPQAGLNLSLLVTDAVTTHVEWAGGRSRSQLNEAFGLAPDTAFRQRLSVGGTWTFDKKVSATLEYQYNSAAPNASQWQRFWELPPQAHIRYNQYLADVQDLATRSGAFLFVSWRDALVPRLDLGAMVRLDLVDYSSMHWLELRYRLPRWDIALQWQRNVGPLASTYGSLSQQQSLMLLAALYF